MLFGLNVHVFVFSLFFRKGCSGCFFIDSESHGASLKTKKRSHPRIGEDLVSLKKELQVAVGQNLLGTFWEDYHLKRAF